MLDAHRGRRSHRSKHLPKPQHHDDDGDEDEDMSISNRILKKLRGKAGKGKKNTLVELNMCEQELDTCNAELAAQIAKDNSPKYLFAQQADKCKLSKKEDGRIFMESSSFLDVTEKFSDRPFRYEYTIPTSTWFGSSGFNNIFNHSKDGWPNAAISLVEDDESVGIVVSAFINGYVLNKDDTVTYGYELYQYDEQAKVMSLDELLGEEDERIFDHCSFFIDDTANKEIGDCVPGNKDTNDAYFVYDPSYYPEFWQSVDMGGTVDITSGSYKVCFKNGDKYCWTKSYYYQSWGQWEPCAPDGSVTTCAGGETTIDKQGVAGWVVQSFKNAQGCADKYDSQGNLNWNSQDTNGACQGVHEETSENFSSNF